MSIIYILIGILFFGFLIAIHELGHCLVAKAFNVKVDEYSIGFGPLLFQKQKGETAYSLRAVPLGGYCAFEEEQSDDPRALVNAKFLPKICIYAAGSVMNFIAGFLAVCILFCNAAAYYTGTIVDFAKDCPLESAEQLQVGDEIYKINGERVYTYSDISLLLGLGQSDAYDLVVIRNGEKIPLHLTMQKATYEDKTGGTFYGYGLFFGFEEATVGTFIKNAWFNTIDFARMVRLSLQMLFNGSAKVSDLSGPVGVVSVMTEAGNDSSSFLEGLENILYLGALIAVNLAVMNLLPIPALDGGKILFLVLNAITMLLFKKKIPERYENYIHSAFLILFLALMVYITCGDVVKLFK